MLKKLLREMEFARHVPLARMISRLRLTARRRLGDLRPGAASGPAPSLRAELPRPLFAPRAASVRREGDDRVFRLLARDTRMPRGRVDWRAGGDQLRRMTLHYMEYLEGLDEATSAAIVEQWLDACDAPAPGAWRDSWSSYALSLRVVVLLQEMARRPALAPSLRRRVATSVAHQLTHLERHLETDIGGNHLIKNVKALLWAAACYEGAAAERWRALGARLLGDEIDRQILPDGVHYERSPSYHCQIFADLLECRAALGTDPFGGKLDDALRRLARATADLAHPDGAVAQFNDSGLGMAYAPGLCLEAFARLFGDAPEPRRVFALAQAGYYGARLGEDYVVVDCGRIGPDDLPAHAHGDVLSFELSVAGRRMIVDQGVYEYVEGERRRASRAAASHNTLALDGADMADFYGAFRCGRRPNVWLRRYEPRGDGFSLEGAHDGYAHLPGRPIPIRRFDVAPGAVTIEDRIDGRTDRAARIGFLLHPEVSAAGAGGALFLARDDARIALTATAPLIIEPAVWWPDMGVETPTLRVVAKPAPGASCRVELRFTPSMRASSENGTTS